MMKKNFVKFERAFRTRTQSRVVSQSFVKLASFLPMICTSFS